MTTPHPPLSPLAQFTQLRRKSLLKIAIFPLIVLAFYIAAPRILESRLHDVVSRQIVTAMPDPALQRQRLTLLDKVSFQAAALRPTAATRQLHQNLLGTGIIAHFQRLQWGFWLSVALVAMLAAALGTLTVLEHGARASRAAFIRNYRTGWHVAIAAALLNVLLLIPLLAYGCYEITTLLMERVFIQIEAAILIGGALAIVRCVQILFRDIQPDLQERFARELTRADAPGLWEAVGNAAQRLNTAPPEHIVVGLQPNFYVTEASLRHELGRTEGRTLFLCYPMLKFLSVEEALAIVGHELEHFIGDDTRLNREFFPLFYKVDATRFLLARSGWSGRSSLHFLNFFAAGFGLVRHDISRQRELLADQRAAALTSPATAAHALVKFHALSAAMQLDWKELSRNTAANPFDPPLRAYVSEKLAANTDFWRRIFEERAPHPLDTHPTLAVRLQSLGQTVSPDEAVALTLQPVESAHARWFAGSDDTVAAVVERAAPVLTKMRQQAQAAAATGATAEERRLLEEHYPRVTWTGHSWQFWVGFGFWALVAALIWGTAIFGPIEGSRLSVMLLGAPFALIAFLVWQRQGDATIRLTATGIDYSGWWRTLEFTEVQSVTLRQIRVFGSISWAVDFLLWDATPAFGRFTVGKRRRARLPLHHIRGDQRAMAETIARYATRVKSAPPVGPK